MAFEMSRQSQIEDEMVNLTRSNSFENAFTVSFIPAYRPGHPVQPDGQRGHAPRRRQLQHLYGGLLCRGRRAVGAFVPTVREASRGAALMTDRATSSEQPRSAYGMRR